MGGSIKIPRKWKILGGGGGGSYVKFPPWWGYGYFLELHISFFFFKKLLLHHDVYSNCVRATMACHMLHSHAGLQGFLN